MPPTNEELGVRITELDLRIKKELRHVRELLALKDESSQRAITLQATEYERRLGILNNENERIADIARTSVPREVYENFRNGIDARINRMESKLSNVDGRIAGISIGIGIFVTVINFAIGILG